jgi:hypothetical protein
MRLREAVTADGISSDRRHLHINALELWNAAHDRVSAQAVALLEGPGYAFLTSADGCKLMQVSVARLRQLAGSWDRLPPDTYLRDGGHYRFRRHSCFVHEVRSGLLSAVAHRPHWQSTQYNGLHGGMDRLFEPIEAQVIGAEAWTQSLTCIGRLFARVQRVDRWFIEAHQFRIDTAEGIGLPTPEGAHRDGVDFVAVILIERRGVRGGETRVHGADGRYASRFKLRECGSMLLMDDTRVTHETSPIRPTMAVGIRDTLVLTYRARGFQSPGAAA